MEPHEASIRFLPVDLPVLPAGICLSSIYLGPDALHYNSRGQLAEIRESTSYTGPNDTDFDRGAIINFYATCWGMCGGYDSTTAMPVNNGNLRRQEIYIPDGPMFAQTFDYDALNRLQSVSEKLHGTGNDTFKQAYTFDRWGNRTFDQANTTANVPHPEYTVDRVITTVCWRLPGSRMSTTPPAIRRETRIRRTARLPAIAPLTLRIESSPRRNR